MKVNYQTKSKIHFIMAIIATLCITTFFISTIIVELFGTHEQIVIVKSLVVMPGLFILVPAVMITGGTGFALSKYRKGRIINGKKRRMPFIGVNGLIILLPSAIFLNQWAAAGSFDSLFYSVQAFELLAGTANLILMGINIRDGIRLSGKLKK